MPDNKLGFIDGLPRRYPALGDKYSTVDLLVMHEHFAAATPENPTECALALAGYDQIGSPVVRIRKTVVWIARPDPDGLPFGDFPGLWAAYAYNVSSPARRIIRKVDEGTATAEDFPMELHLGPVHYYKRPDNRRAAHNRWNARAKAGTTKPLDKNHGRTVANLKRAYG